MMSGGGGGGSAYNYVSGVNIVGRLMVDSEGNLKKQASVLVRVGEWLARQLDAQERQKYERGINSMGETINRSNNVINNARQNESTAALNAQKKFISDGLSNYRAGTSQFNMAAKGLGAAIGGKQGALGDRGTAKYFGDPSGGQMQGLNEAEKGYVRFYENLKNLDESTAQRMGSNMYARMSQYEKLQRYAGNYYNEEKKGRDYVNLAYQKTIDDINTEINARRAMVNDLIKQGVLKGKDAQDAKARLAERIALLKDQQNTVRSLRDTTTQAGKAEGIALDEVKRKTQEATEAKRLAGIRMKEMNEKLKELNARALAFGQNLAMKVGTALANFRTVLMTTATTLALVYWRLTRVTGALVDFDKELINAQSIWQTSSEQLYNISNQVVAFGQSFGVQYNNAAASLYQFASAGLSASEAMAVLNSTLKLSMAVQGDTNTIGKLVVQTIKGFGLQMSDAQEITDKFAFAINKSLLEWQDLSSAVKFSMPFFVSTGQSIEQLLGALQVLTNRALEAGIAGRGLRQALAEFTQHAEDNSAAFRKMGIEIMNTDGTMKDLVDIALQFNATIGAGQTDMDVMIALMEDLNIRGATAFVHLAQNADEYAQAVSDLENSAGAAHEMAMIQQRSLVNQIQILKNALLAPFILADEAHVAEGYMNAFHKELVLTVESIKAFFLVGEEGNEMLTENGYILQQIVIAAFTNFKDIVLDIIDIVQRFTKEGYFNIAMLELYFLPLSLIIKGVQSLPPDIGKLMVAFWLLNKTLFLTTAGWFIYEAGIVAATFAHFAYMVVMGESIAAMALYPAFAQLVVYWTILQAHGWRALATAMAPAAAMFSAMAISFAAALWISDKISGMSAGWRILAAAIAVAAAAVIAFAIASTFGAAAPGIIAGMAAVGMAAGLLYGAVAPKISASPDLGDWESEYESYLASIEGNAPVIPSAGGGDGTGTLNVETLNVRQDNLNSTFYDSVYTT
jgi:TP901 family phage tail tape measure protein